MKYISGKYYRINFVFVIAPNSVYQNWKKEIDVHCPEDTNIYIWKVSKDNLLYKCNWSPFENKTFKSRILHTLVNGNLVFSQGKIIESGKGMKIMFER